MDCQLKVLIVEDEALVGMGLEKALEKMGYHTLGVARTGEEAISTAFLKKPDVILMDIQISGSMDGIEVSERINQEISIPVVFLTAYNDDKYIERCVKTGSYGFLTKPAGQQEIKAAIEIAVSRHRAFKAEEGMRKKESILKVVGLAAQEFLSGKSFEKGINDIFMELGRLGIFERVCLFKNKPDICNNPVMQLYMQWDSKTDSVVENNEKTILYSDFDPAFEETLQNNKMFFGSTDSLNKKNSNYFKIRFIESVLAVPVFSGDEWWGILCFETSRKTPDWSEGEKEGLCAAATIIGSAIFNKKLNKEIISNEEKYRSLYNLLRIMCDNVPDMIWAKDPEGRYTFANRTLCMDALKIEDTGEPLGKNIEYFIDSLREKNPKDPRINVLERRKKDNPLKNDELKGPYQSVYNINVDNKSLYYDLYEAPFYDEDEKLLGIVGCGRNITVEKEYENSLIEINARFTAFMDKLPACAYIRDSEGNILYANRYTKEVFGVDNRSLLSSPEIFGERDPGALDDVNKRIFDSGILETEGTFILSDKKTHTLKFILFPISGSGFKDVTGAIAIDITDSKESELNILESEQKYRLLFENANDAIYVGDGKVCIDCNTKMSRLLGYKRDEIIGRSISDFSPKFQPDGRLSDDKIKELIHLSLKGEEIDIFDWQAVKKSGEFIDTKVSMNMVKIGSRIHMFLVIRDITREKKIESALRESEIRYRSLVDKSPIGIEIFQDEQIVYINPSIAEILSMSMAEIMDKQFSELVHPDDLDFILETNRKRHLGLEVPDNYKVRVIDGKGLTKTINTYVVPIEWDKRPATLNFLTDITEKEMFDDALKESEERYRSVVENAKINILIAQDEKLCYVNPSTAEFIGFSNEELVSKNFLDFIYEEDREKVIENHRLRLSDKNNKSLSENYTIRAYNFKGELRTLDFNTTVIQWNGKPATLNFLIDITDQIESRKLLEKALLEKTILLQEVHHRVKNNLALINSLLSMQIRNSSSGDVTDSLREAETRIYSIAAVHEGLYRSSSISSIAAEEHFIALGEEIISNYSPDFRIKLDVSAKGCELGLNAAIPISLVINELLTNSIKYAFKGREKGRIYIKMDCTGDLVKLYVGDDGVGVPEDFDLLRTETLGMTLVRNIIIMQLDGTLKLERNEGTRWIITLPHL